ncbi:MAG: DUF1343 domain-containing protein [Proteobacteria bacterium]|nr:DUF1343 domain-containing protein [Pseudomonadota bacterium]
MCFQPNEKISSGLDNLLRDHLHLLRERKVGLVAHPASVSAALQHILPALLARNIPISALFGPEHGFGGEAQDMEAVHAPQTGPSGIPLHSLYGASADTLAPQAEHLAPLDVLVVDLADVGSRYYTYTWTAVLCLRACRDAGIEMILLDRPNPLGGEIVEGPVQRDGFLSFVGLCPVAIRHGLTMGEILQMVAHREGLSDHLRVIPMQGWQRHMFFDDTGLPWVTPSPNMPTLETAFVYPGGCLLEATNVSEGRGTTQPFLQFGAPHIDSRHLCAQLNGARLDGVVFRETSFRPMFQKHQGRTCHGAFVHITDRRTFRPYRAGLTVLHALFATADEGFAWRDAPYEFVSDIPAIDLLSGSPHMREALHAGAAPEEIAADWEREERAFALEKKQFHLYT